MIEASLDFTLIKLFSFKKKLTWFLKNVAKRKLIEKLYYSSLQNGSQEFPKQILRLFSTGRRSFII